MTWVKEAVLFNTFSLLYIRLLGTSCQWSPVVVVYRWCWLVLMKDDKQHVFLYITGHYETSHALHSCSAGGLVLCKVRGTSTTTAFLSWLCYCYYICGVYCRCGSTPYLKCTKVWHWCQNRRRLVGISDVLKQMSMAHCWVKVLYTAICEHGIPSVVTYYFKCNFDLFSVVMIKEWLEPCVPKWKQCTKDCDIKCINTENYINPVPPHSLHEVTYFKGMHTSLIIHAIVTAAA